jgi:glycerophosphoryl diester phosphodiesterase
MRADNPLVIGHRGACGYRPEHTLASYLLAMEQGADYVEPDLVSTRDGVLVARHENEISGTTDVAARPEFADRLTTRTVGARSVTGWFTEDFTLEELKTLRAVERLPLLRPANTRWDGHHEIPTFDEVLDLVESESIRRGQVIGVYPETKNPGHFRSHGLPLEEILVATLRARHLDRPNAEVYVQSFDAESLSRLSGEVSVPLVRLVGLEDGALLTPRWIRETAVHADALGIHHHLVNPALVAQVHDAGLEVHAWTMRGGPEEYARMHDAGVDGVFSDHPDVAVAARAAWCEAQASGIRIQATT